jgi:secretion/DNA translocation related CpaE-like protein
MYRPLIVTSDAALLDRILGVADAAGVPMDVVADLSLGAQLYDTAPVVLLGADLRPGSIAAPRRGGVVMVSDDLDDGAVWDRAARLSCEHVVLLPDGGDWLLDRLRTATGLGRPAGPVVAVLGGRGGAGASVLAAALAYTAARTGRFTSLVDADPLGGGLDLLFSDDGAPVDGDWEPGERMLARLELLVRGHGAGATSPASLHETLAQAAARQDLVVVDVPRGDRLRCEAALAVADSALLVVPAEVRAVVAAAAVARLAAPWCPQLAVVVRTSKRTLLDPEVVHTSLGLPLAGVLGEERGLAGDLDRGVPPGRRHGPLRRLAEVLLQETWRSTQKVA